MKSAFECFQHAAACERMADCAKDEESRITLLENAGQWRLLGTLAQIQEAKERPDRSPSSDLGQSRDTTRR
jgi:hypothetical protein